MNKETNFRLKERLVAIGIMVLVQISALMLLINKIIDGGDFFLIIGVSLILMLIYNQYCFVKTNNEIWKKP